ncbi:hypothetical protein [Prochlorococcus sp. MIT 0604]|uniref:hypothetical protein n=1 Tax=Prochlorococcus sp. MIT 0604 TaxID=1501268 RepID=UPI0004F7C3AA|nr:hypothetical protein [Prochlorococcus sp. MIT 0604]AIQ96010.1 hypothetical protein EW14_2003 [Prochlorococcus sp. MIT 0604]
MYSWESVSYVNYDAWFIENIDPADLFDYLNEKEFSNKVHKKFLKISSKNLIVGFYDNFLN